MPPFHLQVYAGQMRANFRAVALFAHAHAMSIHGMAPLLGDMRPPLHESCAGAPIPEGRSPSGRCRRAVARHWFVWEGILLSERTVALTG